MNTPILYTFRRCPYAMRARLALLVANIETEWHEVSLKNKPAEMLMLSPKGTVPVLVLPDGRVIEESLEIMYWALEQSDPQHWLLPAALEQAKQLISENDIEFKYHLDRFKYPNRYQDVDPQFHLEQASAWLLRLNARLAQHAFLCAEEATLADYALMPFIRQFARVDWDWFKAAPWPHLMIWLENLMNSDLFKCAMLIQ